MRMLLFLLVACSIGSTAGAAPYFNVRFSRPLAVHLFVQELSGNGRPGNSFQKLYTGSRFDTPERAAALADLDTLQLDYTYEFPQYPELSKIPMQTRDLLQRNLLFSADLNAFKQRATGLLPKRDLARLVHTLELFAPVYDSLVYAPLEQEFNQQLQACEKALRRPAVVDFFQKMSRFHGQPDSGTDTFQIVFYPLPKSRNFRATAFADCSVSAIPEGERDYEMLLSVTLHEMAHILYDEQPLALKEQLQAAFRNNPAPGAWNAYLLLNEAQATALGNGAAFFALTGELDTGPWYNNKYRNEMAKAIYPMVAEYLAQNKPIDSAFVTEYCRLYTTRFPQWENEAAHLFTNRFLIAASDADAALFSQQFPVTAQSYTITPVTTAGFQKMRSSTLTKVLVLDAEKPAQLRQAESYFPMLIKHPELRTKGFTRFRLADQSWLYVVLTKGPLTKELLQQL